MSDCFAAQTNQVGGASQQEASRGFESADINNKQEPLVERKN
jgi:hypothetical protein